jgi:hypothetical protein
VSFLPVIDDAFGLSDAANDADPATVTKDRATIFAAPSIARREPLLIIISRIVLAWTRFPLHGRSVGLYFRDAVPYECLPPVGAITYPAQRQG